MNVFATQEIKNRRNTDENNVLVKRCILCYLNYNFEALLDFEKKMFALAGERILSLTTPPPPPPHPPYLISMDVSFRDLFVWFSIAIISIIIICKMGGNLKSVNLIW